MRATDHLAQSRGSELNKQRRAITPVARVAACLRGQPSRLVSNRRHGRALEQRLNGFARVYFGRLCKGRSRRALANERTLETRPSTEEVSILIHYNRVHTSQREGSGSGSGEGRAELSCVERELEACSTPRAVPSLSEISAPLSSPLLCSPQINLNHPRR